MLWENQSVEFLILRKYFKDWVFVITRYYYNLFLFFCFQLLLITKLRIKDKIKYNNNKSIFYKEKMPKTKLE